MRWLRLFTWRFKLVALGSVLLFVGYAALCVAGLFALQVLAVQYHDHIYAIEDLSDFSLISFDDRGDPSFLGGLRDHIHYNVSDPRPLNRNAYGIVGKSPVTQWWFCVAGFGIEKDSPPVRPMGALPGLEYNELNIQIPKLPTLILATLPLLLVFRKIKRTFGTDFRRRSGLCTACGYDLRGIAANCPECGFPIHQA